MFKEGDKVRINPNAPTRESYAWNSGAGMDKTRGETGIIICIREDRDDVAYVDTGITGKWSYHFSDLEKITEETTMKPELKFEIGKKYNLKHFCSNPYIYLDDARKHGFEVECRHVFRDCEGDIIEIEEADIESAEEYKEPYKKTIEGWLVYEDMDAPGSNWLTEALLNKSSAGYIYPTQEEAHRRRSTIGANKMHVRITLEEIPDE